MIERNKIPAHWKIKSISDVCEILDGLRRPVNSTERMKRIKDKPENELFPYYGATGQVGLIDNYILDGEYILLGEDGAPFIDPFKEKAYLVQGKMWVNNHAHILKSRHSNKFLYYYLNNVNYKEFVSGTTRLKLNKSSLREIPVPIPPLAEQQLIVEKIEELFSELDAGRRQLEVVKKQLVTYRQSVLKFAFEGKFTKTKFVESKTGNIVDIINNGYTPSREFLSEDFGDIPFIKVYNLNFNGTLNFKKNPTFIPKDIHKNQLKRSICLPGDVLINIVGPPLGKVSIVTDQFPEWNINQAIVMFRPNEKVISKYLSYFLQNSATINWLEETSKATAGQWNVKVSTCREIPIPVCSPEEQEIVVNEIESRLSVCEKLEETIETCLQRSEALKQSILKQAFEGKLVKSPINCK